MVHLDLYHFKMNMTFVNPFFSVYPALTRISSG